MILDCDNQNTCFEWFELEENDGKRLVDVEEIQPRKVQAYLKKYAANYDIIFIDVPRMTDNNRDSATVMLLYYCDYVVVPVVGSQVDVLSSLNFIEVLKDAKRDMEMIKEDFFFYGFINRRNRRKDNQHAEKALKESGIDMFDNSLADLKLFTNPSFVSSLLDTKEGRERFEPFFNKFCNKLNIQ